MIEVQKALKLKEDISKRVKEGIDNYDSTPGQKKLQNRIKWQEKQSVYESHFTQAQKFLNEPAYADVITENMKTMAAAD